MSSRAEQGKDRHEAKGGAYTDRMSVFPAGARSHVGDTYVGELCSRNRGFRISRSMSAFARLLEAEPVNLVQSNQGGVE